MFSCKKLLIYAFRLTKKIAWEPSLVWKNNFLNKLNLLNFELLDQVNNIPWFFRVFQWKVWQILLSDIQTKRQNRLQLYINRLQLYINRLQLYIIFTRQNSNDINYIIWYNTSGDEKQRYKLYNTIQYIRRWEATNINYIIRYNTSGEEKQRYKLYNMIHQEMRSNKYKLCNTIQYYQKMRSNDINDIIRYITSGDEKQRYNYIIRYNTSGDEKQRYKL